MPENDTADEQQPVNRRIAIKAAAWAVPTVVVALVAAPARASS